MSGGSAGMLPGEDWEPKYSGLTTFPSSHLL